MSQDGDQPPTVLPADSPAALPSHSTDWAEFDQFCRNHRSQLLRFVHQRARSDGLPESSLDAEGVVQETFLLAYLDWSTIRYPRGWIYKVAARKVREHCRQEWFQTRELRQRLQAAFSEGSDSDPAYTYAVASIVLDRINALPTQQRIATYLSLVLGWTGPEIAQFLHITAATVYVHEHRGRQAVQRSEGESHTLSGTAPGGSYRPSRAERPSVPRLLAAWALLLLMIAAIAGLVWLVGAAWVTVAIIGCLFTVGAWIFRRD